MVPGPSGGRSAFFGATEVLEATCRFHPVTREPMETLHKQEKTEHNSEWNIELVAEDGKGQQGLRNEHPCLVV